MNLQHGIYLDHAATSPIRPEVIQRMTLVMGDVYGNPSSIHSFGREAKKLVEMARQSVAKSIGSSSDEVVFTSGGTESDNLAILGMVKAQKELGKHIITTQVEHPAVLNTMRYLERNGYEVTYLPVTSQGELRSESVQEALRSDTIMVSTMYANNETGILFPIEEISTFLSSHQAIFHVDAVQAYQHVPIDVQNIKVDVMSLSAHKINGPKGTGALYIRNGVIDIPQMYGGDQEKKRRPGTENVVSLLGFGIAADFIRDETIVTNQQNYTSIQNKLLSELNRLAIPYDLNGGGSKLANIINVWIKGVESKLLVPALDIEGFAVSAGSACMAGDVHSSHVLGAMHGEDSRRVVESIRVSLGLGNTEDEIIKFVETIKKIKNRMNS